MQLKGAVEIIGLLLEPNQFHKLVLDIENQVLK